MLLWRQYEVASAALQQRKAKLLARQRRHVLRVLRVEAGKVGAAKDAHDNGVP